MKYTDILEEYWNDYKTDIYPKDRRMTILDIHKVRGMSTENIRFLINETVKRYARRGTYVEAGMYRGCSLLSAALFNPTTECWGMDNFSEFADDKEKARHEIFENLKKFRHPKNIRWAIRDYRQFLEHWQKTELLKNGPFIDVFLYDAKHDFMSTSIGLETVMPLMKDKCIIIVDDIDYKEVQKAVERFLRLNEDFSELFRVNVRKEPCEIGEEKFYDQSWWNGISIISRGIK